MLPPGLTSASQVVLYYDRVYDDLISSGAVQPCVYPWMSAGVAVVLVYLLIDHRKSRSLALLRYPVFALLCVFQGWILLTNRARDPAAGFFVGLFSALGVFWVAAYMICNDCQTDYSRIEARDPTLPPAAGSKTERSSTLYWQGYPDTLLERIDWIVDMFFSFRGVGWSWQTNGVPPAPKWVQAALDGREDSHERYEPVTSSKTGIRRMTSLREVLWDTIPKAALGYLISDAFKTIITNDPYFWGYTDAPPPAHYPEFMRSSHFLTKWSRLLTTMISLQTALWTIYKLGPVLFAGILGPRLYGLRGEVWMNPPDMFGSFNMVLDKGLGGFWGGWWHQTFRYGFEAPGTKALSLLGIDKHSQAGKMLSLFTAFFLSGCLHAAGSYTQLGENRPLRGPMAFFLLQGVGVVVETSVSSLLKRQGIQLPRLVQRAKNLAFVLFWMYYTGPLFVDDFAQGGVWLFEPVPISIFRGLGFGASDTGWWCWWHRTTWWRVGNSWHDTGIVF